MRSVGAVSVLVLVAAGCGGSVDLGKQVADSSTCEELGVAVFDLTQAVLDRYGSLSIDEARPRDRELVEPFAGVVELLDERQSSLGCSGDEVVAYTCDHIDDFRVQGQAASSLLGQIVEPCFQ